MPLLTWHALFRPDSRNCFFIYLVYSTFVSTIFHFFVFISLLSHFDRYETLSAITLGSILWIKFAFLWIFRKNFINNISSKNQKRQRVIAFILVNTIPHTLKSNTYHSNKRVPPPFSHSDTNPVFGHVLIHYFDKAGFDKSNIAAETCLKVINKKEHDLLPT